MAKRFIYLTLFLALFTALVQTASAAEKSEKPYSFTTHTLKVGSIQIQIDPVDLITQTDVKQTLTYRLANFSDAPIECSLTFSGCEALRTLSQSAEVTVPANGMEERTLEFIVESGAYSAHYPIRATVTFQENGKKRVIEANWGRTGRGTNQRPELRAIRTTSAQAVFGWATPAIRRTFPKGGACICRSRWNCPLVQTTRR